MDRFSGGYGWGVGFDLVWISIKARRLEVMHVIHLSLMKDTMAREGGVLWIHSNWLCYPSENLFLMWSTTVMRCMVMMKEGEHYEVWMYDRWQMLPFHVLHALRSLYYVDERRSFFFL